jgi:DNA-binding NarL/FixJ family response regulator
MKDKNIFITINDKDQFLSKVIKSKLKKEVDWEVEVTNNYDEAIEILKNSNPSIIVTEILLNDSKGRSGFDLITEIKAFDHLKDSKIAVLSDLKQSSDQEFAKTLGADYYFVKSQMGISEIIASLKLIIKNFLAE